MRATVGKFVRMAKGWKQPLHNFVYQGLAEATRVKVAVRIDDPAYPAPIIGLEWSGALAWVYEDDTVDAR